MAKYIVSYDLRGEDRENDYAKLERELEDTYNAKRLLQSEWGLSSDLTPLQLHTRIKRLLRFEDGLMVLRVIRGKGSGLENKLSSF